MNKINGLKLPAKFVFLSTFQFRIYAICSELNSLRMSLSARFAKVSGTKTKIARDAIKVKAGKVATKAKRANLVNAKRTGTKAAPAKVAAQAGKKKAATKAAPVKAQAKKKIKVVKGKLNAGKKAKKDKKEKNPVDGKAATPKKAKAKKVKETTPSKTTMELDADIDSYMAAKAK